jgi:hypothetical protein
MAENEKETCPKCGAEMGTRPHYGWVDGPSCLTARLSAAERENERLRAACANAIDLPELIGRLEHEHRQYLRACIETDVAEIVANLKAALTPPAEGGGRG